MYTNSGFETVIRLALFETCIRDPFDRVIVAQAKSGNAGLIPDDSKIQERYPKVIW